MHNETTDNDPISGTRKPVVNESAASKGVLLKTLLSLGLYIGVYYIFFHQNLQWIFLLVAVMLFHEAGHFIAMKSFGYKDVKMFFVPFLGAFVSGEPERVSQKQRVITLLAGPIPGIFLGLILLGVFSYTQQVFYYRLSLILIMLNVFNLLPVSPLDGGQLLENLFLRSGRLLQPVFLILSAIALFYMALITRNYFILIIVWLIVVRFRTITRMNRVRSALDKDGISYDKIYAELSDDEYMAIRARLIQNIPALKDYDPNIISDDEEFAVSHMQKLLSDKAEADMSKTAKAFVIAIWIIFTVVPIFIFWEYVSAYRII